MHRASARAILWVIEDRDPAPGKWTLEQRWAVAELVTRLLNQDAAAGLSTGAHKMIATASPGKKSSRLNKTQETL